MPLNIPTSCQQRQKADNCEVYVRFYYHDRTYAVEFGTTFISRYYRSVYILPKNYLSYTAMYSCSHNDNCAIDFANKKVLDLSNRTFNVNSVTNQLSNVLLEHRQPSDPALRCYDNKECTSGMCQVEYDTSNNKVNKRGCEPVGIARVHVFDGGNLPSLDIECNRTRCNSPEAYNEVKQILFQHNLTDINGRINDGQKLCVPAVLLIILFHLFVFYITNFSSYKN
ncbi:unnamed protein product [Adineta steineri]|uniref:Uncharacterized protein n=1 Tax=Adineta steineri TaxID=433720 RepID=A0A815JBP2_9BILA|nr:unnamed protein product [Adineta steineri]CAF1375802.1 unnamed protein product [Adineta steineri]CAF1601188.1 unnamed protein product [Adineta steineri]CAF1605656.1 unnamed protein product [Adineta steineri]